MKCDRKPLRGTTKQQSSWAGHFELVELHLLRPTTTGDIIATILDGGIRRTCYTAMTEMSMYTLIGVW